MVTAIAPAGMSYLSGRGIRCPHGGVEVWRCGGVRRGRRPLIGKKWSIETVDAITSLVPAQASRRPLQTLMTTWSTTLPGPGIRAGWFRGFPAYEAPNCIRGDFP
jgi:hypothetical protein